MRYTTSRNVQPFGPAAYAQRSLQIQQINRGLPQKPYRDAAMMRRGGSMGHQLITDPGIQAHLVGPAPKPYTGPLGPWAMAGLGFHDPRLSVGAALGCLCGPGDPGFFGAVNAPNVVKVGPIAARMLQLRKNGMAPKLALLDAMANLAKAGITHVTPEIHAQLAAGMQPIGGLSGLLGALGLAPIVRTGITSGSVAASSVGIGAASAIGLGSGIALGQTVIPIPVVGAVIGAIVFEAAHLLKRHVGKAEAAWANQAFYNSLRSMNGRDYDEKQYSEAFKGMMDTGNNIIPGCGPDRHKNPDCFMQPLAATIARGYLSGAVPLSATTRDVYNQVVVPWLQSGAGGLVNWSVLRNEPTQQLMIQAATDRYLADQPMTRGDMASYGNQGLHTPTLVQALQSILQQPTTTTPQVPGTPAVQPPIVQPVVQPTTGVFTGDQYSGGQYALPIMATGPVIAPRGGTYTQGPTGGATPPGLAPTASKIPWGLIATAVGAGIALL